MYARQLNRLRLTTAWTLAALLLLTLTFFQSAMAAAPANSLIRNQASATYFTDDGREQFVTSNVVETVVRQVAGITLNQDNLELSNLNRAVTFPHIIVNSGNGPDSYLLSTSQSPNDNFDLLSVAMFADTDRNGIADNTTPITTTPVLAADESFSFVVIGTVPSNVTAPPSTSLLTVLAQSTFDNTVTQTNLDTTQFTPGVVINVSKSIDITTGKTPSSPYTVTLTYRNDGAEIATDMTLIDRLPDGMEYIAGSARWSETGTLVLTDNNPADIQGSGSSTIQFCAYQANCTGVPESILDSDTDSTNQVTAIIASVPVGAQGTLTFDISIAAGLTGTELFNIAEYEYTDNGNVVDRAQTNIVGFRLSHDTGVVANGSTTSAVDGSNEPVSLVSAFQGSTIAFDNIIWNTGTSSDMFDVIIDSASSTFPSGTAFQLFREDGATPLVDNNGNGIPDTGPLASNANTKVVLRVFLPADAVGDNNGLGFQVTTIARSTNDASISNTVVNTIDTIFPSAVDLAATPVSGGPAGVGAGPEAATVVENAALPGGTTRFSLFLDNNGDNADQLVLSASTDPTFATETLPDGWTVNFRNDTDTENISSTGSIPGVNTFNFFADISIPADQESVVQSIYFRALSPATGAVDILHASVSISDAQTLLLEPAGAAQIETGSSFVYSHRIENTSNTAIGPIQFTTSDSLASEGWASILYADSDGDGVFTAADAELGNITNLPGNQSDVFFVRVFAPSTAPAGAFNVTTITAVWNGGSNSTQIDNVTTITTSDIAISKEQAPDLGCDGILDGPYSQQPFQLEPGNNCVRYRLTATNAGVEPVFNAVIKDATPAFTVYQPAAACSAVACTITEPAAGGTGIVSGEVASVGPGESVEFTFAVIIE